MGREVQPDRQDQEVIMRSDSDIRRDVEFELKWDPDIDSTDIAVAVKNGVVTLTGFVRSFNDKWEAELAAKRVAGVVAVANDIEVRLPTIDERPDPEIARDAVAALRNELPYSSENIRVVVKDGWVTLEGAVEWNYQREMAEGAVRRVRGVKGVTNSIQLKPRVQPSDIKRQIEEAFRRSAEIDANRITVEANGSEVILKGTVRSWAEREEAERTAWRAPGVTKVDNRIIVRPS
jgi:osmotically-inducible protein OsmY